MKKIVPFFVLALCLALSAEILFSNCDYFLYHRKGDTAKILRESTAACFVLRSGDTFFLSDMNEDLDLKTETRVHALSFSAYTAGSAENALCTLDFSLSLSDSPAQFHKVKTEKLCIGDSPSDITLNIPSDFQSGALRISLRDGACVLCLKDITVNPQWHFSFQPLRFGVILFAFLILGLFVCFNAFQTLFDPCKKKHRLFAATVVFVCVVTTFLFVMFCNSGDTKSIAYPLENKVETYQPFIQQFDAFCKGQANLDCAVSDALASLADPYDKESRTGITYLWDRAFYNGKYYSYFGVAPLATAYLPFYLATGKLPADKIVIGFFALLAALFWSLGAVEWVRVFQKKISLSALAVGTYALLFSGGLFLYQRGKQPFYFIALLSAAAFSGAFVFFILRAFGTKKQKCRLPLLAGAGVFFGLAFLSRVNTVIPLALMTAVFLIIYAGRYCKTKKKPAPLLTELACLGVPVALALGWAFWFNNLRFGSPLDFGTAYQLTVSDTSQNKLYAGGIAFAAYHYFYQRVALEDVFPYIRLSSERLPNYGKAYTYIDSNYGVFNMPVFFGIPLCVTSFLRRKNPFETPLILWGTLSLFFTAFFDFCLGGVIFRYVGDISFIGAFLCVAVFWNLAQKPLDTCKWAKIAFALTNILCHTVFVLGIFAGFFLAVSNSLNILPLPPGVYAALRSIWTLG